MNKPEEAAQPPDFAQECAEALQDHCLVPIGLDNTTDAQIYASRAAQIIREIYAKRQPDVSTIYVQANDPVARELLRSAIKWIDRLDQRRKSIPHFFDNDTDPAPLARNIRRYLTNFDAKRQPPGLEQIVRDASHEIMANVVPCTWEDRNKLEFILKVILRACQRAVAEVERQLSDTELKCGKLIRELMKERDQLKAQLAASVPPSAQLQKAATLIMAVLDDFVTTDEWSEARAWATANLSGTESINEGSASTESKAEEPPPAQNPPSGHCQACAQMRELVRDHLPCCCCDMNDYVCIRCAALKLPCTCSGPSGWIVLDPAQGGDEPVLWRDLAKGERVEKGDRVVWAGCAWCPTEPSVDDFPAGLWQRRIQIWHRVFEAERESARLRLELAQVRETIIAAMQQPLPKFEERKGES